MLAYIIDCESAQWSVLTVAAPTQTRSAVFSAFLAEMSTTTQVGLDQRPLLAFALPYASPPRRNMALSAADDPEGSIALDDRPWELLGQMWPIKTSHRHEDMFLSTRNIKDTASIPMSLFGPRFKRDAIYSEPESTWDEYASERTLGDGLAGEPLAAKQAATLLFAGTDDDVSSPRTALTPAESVITRPRRHSTRNLAGSSSRDAIPVPEDDSDDSSDSEEADPPLAKRPRTGSKTTTRATTGGKAPAKRVTGGKSVARKATGGKGVARKTGGKAPRKR
jgi:mediator of RNA polymerase II transcription subunit 12